MLEFINSVMQKLGLGGMISDSAIAKIVQGGLEKISNGISKIDPNLGQKMKESSEKLGEGKTDQFVSSLKEMKESLKQDSKYSVVYSELTDFLGAAHELVGSNSKNRAEAFGKFVKESKELGRAIVKSVGSSSSSTENNNSNTTNTENK